MGLADGQVALVTGAGSGIGHALALALARDGARAVVVADIDGDAAARTAATVLAAGTDALACTVDVRDEDQVGRMMALVVARFGILDAAYNNAGTRIEGGHRTTATIPYPEWRRVIEVNLHGTFVCMQHEIRVMAAQRHGVIVNTASIAGITGVPLNAVYAASKHGVLGLTKSAALEVAEFGVRVNAVCPGPVATPMLAAGLETLHLVAGVPDADKLASLGAQVPLGSVMEPEDIANAAVWLCSPLARLITGESLVVDGGQYAARSR